jgi:hypothetical protein
MNFRRVFGKKLHQSHLGGTFQKKMRLKKENAPKRRNLAQSVRTAARRPAKEI